MLEGDRVLLTPLVPDDAAAMFRWLNDPELVRATGPYRPVDWASHQAWFDSVGRDQGKVVFAIRRKTGGQMVGYIQIVNIHPVFCSAEIAVIIGEAAQRRQGLGLDALRLAMRFCWNDLNLQRLTALLFGENPAGTALYHKAGFQPEAVLREAAFIDGRDIDIHILAAFRLH